MGINISRKIAIVTGINTGIGLESTKTLAYSGAVIIGPARNVNMAKLNLLDIPNIEIVQMKLMDPDSINGTELAREALMELFLQMGFYDEKGNRIHELFCQIWNNNFIFP